MSHEFATTKTFHLTLSICTASKYCMVCIIVDGLHILVRDELQIHKQEYSLKCISRKYVRVIFYFVNGVSQGS